MTTKPVLCSGAVYWADGGSAVCVDCAGASARYTGRDLSGHRVKRVSLADVRAWEAEPDLGMLGCECRRVLLSTIATADGWPMARERPLARKSGGA